MFTERDYEEIIRWKKQEYNINGWNEMILNAKEFMEEVSDTYANIEAATQAMMRNMLEGDRFVVEPANRHSEELTICYYCDNLSESRRRLF